MNRLYAMGSFLISLILLQAEGAAAEDPGSVKPFVNVTSPTHQQMFEVGRRIFIEASAKDADGSVAEVVFSVNGQRIGEADTEFPYQSIFFEIQSPGIFRIDAVATDNEGNASIPDTIVIYGVPSPDNKPTVYDPVHSGQDFLIQTFNDLLYRDPTDVELNQYLEELEFGAFTKAQVLEKLFETAELRNLLDSHNIYQAIIGEWPSPEEFVSVLQGIDAVGDSEPVNTDDDVGNTFESALVLSPGDRSFSGIFGNYADVDIFTFQIFRETVVNLFTTGPFDTKGSLYDADGNLLATDDDSGEFFNFKIEKNLPRGRYYLSVAGWAGTIGTYNLELQFGNEVQLPENHFAPVTDLNKTIFSLYNSQAYYDRYGLLPDLSASERDRRSIFRQLYRNRFGTEPSLQQLQQGASRMLRADTVESFTAAFIRNDRVGVEPCIDDLPDMKSRDDAAFLICSLLKVRASRDKINALVSLSFEEKVNSLLSDPDYLDRFAHREADEAASEAIVSGDDVGLNFIRHSDTPFLNDSAFLEKMENPFDTLDQSANGWKYLDWFGWFSDLEYPWIYHEKMGWVEIKPINKEEMWLWNGRFDWTYTGAQSFPYLYRYLDERWIRLEFQGQPGEFEIIEPTE